MVVLTEPALKPSTEDQAIRRVYRMGQARSVQVYRLLAKDSVDEHLEAILHDKRRLFRAYAHDSDAKRGPLQRDRPQHRRLRDQRRRSRSRHRR